MVLRTADCALAVPLRVESGFCLMRTVGVAADTGGNLGDAYGRLNAVGGARSLSSGCSRDDSASDSSVLRFSRLYNVRVRLGVRSHVTGCVTAAPDVQLH